MDKIYSREEIESIYYSLKDFESSKTGKGVINLFLDFFEEHKVNKEVSYSLKPMTKLARIFYDHEQLIKEILYWEQSNSVMIIPVVLYFLNDLKKRSGRIPISQKKEYVHQNIAPILKERGFEKYINNSLNKAHRVLNNLQFIGLIQKQGEFFIFTRKKTQYNLFCLNTFVRYLGKSNIELQDIYTNKFAKDFLMNQNDIYGYLENMRESNIISLITRANLSIVNLKINKIEELFDVLRK